MSFADKFKDKKTSQILDKLKEKYKPQEKNISQNKILQILEEEKLQEKDENIKGNYDLIIQAVKDFFAKKFNQEKARQTVIQALKNDLLAQKALKIIEKKQELEELAKRILGDKFVEFMKKNNSYVKKNSKSNGKDLSLHKN